jgi:glycosyltransferase involved in cell wall biosynthesis
MYFELVFASQVLSNTPIGTTPLPHNVSEASMIRVLALTFGDETTASSYYRIFQYIQPLREHGIHLQPTSATGFSSWDEAAAADCVIVQKKLLKRTALTRLRRTAKRLVYDVDDAIWHPHRRPHSWLTNWRTRLRLACITRLADVCVAANDVLAEQLRRFTPRVVVVPMALDEKRWYPLTTRSAGAPLRIGWAGHPVNLTYLQQIEPALVQTQQQFSTVEFAIFSGQPPEFSSLRFTHLHFAPGTEPETIRNFVIGLLPLPDDDFSAAKSPIKGLQYMACGIPTVVAPVGAAAQMFADHETALFARNLSEWQAALARLISEASLRAQLGRHARRVFETTYTLSRTTTQLASVLRG